MSKENRTAVIRLYHKSKCQFLKIIYILQSPMVFSDQHNDILCWMSPYFQWLKLKMTGYSHCKWPQLATILTSFDFSKSLISELKQASHGWKDLNFKNRVKTDRIYFFFKKIHPWIRLPEKIWRFGCPMKLDARSFSVKSQSALLQFCHLTNFAKETNLSVKSSWEVCWIIMLKEDVVCYEAARVASSLKID